MIDFIDEDLRVGTSECLVCSQLLHNLRAAVNSDQPDPVWMEASRRLDAHYTYCDKVRAERRRRWWRARIDWFRKLLSRLTGGSRQ